LTKAAAAPEFEPEYRAQNPRVRQAMLARSRADRGGVADLD
jgi:hypothetical protein